MERAGRSREAIISDVRRLLYGTPSVNEKGNVVSATTEVTEDILAGGEVQVPRERLSPVVV